MKQFQSFSLSDELFLIIFLNSSFSQHTNSCDEQKLKLKFNNGKTKSHSTIISKMVYGLLRLRCERGEPAEINEDFY